MSAAMKARRPEPSEIEFKNMRFLIMDRPTDATLDKFIEVGGVLKCKILSCL